MKLIVGLGNPGPKYDGTRHNIGFAVLDYLAAAPSVGGWRSRFQAKVAEGQEGDQQVLLMKPETFMNLSGRAVREAVDFYKLNLADVLVITDDRALPLGKLRVRSSGSCGGHNGLRNIEQVFGTNQYSRLRMGIGEPSGHQDAIDFVLGRFRPSERSEVDKVIADAAQAVLLWVGSGVDVCMNRINGGEPKPGKPKKERPKKDVPSDGSMESRPSQET
jgi:PTH1 family peptidyl-tRNA hydrolase